MPSRRDLSDKFTNCAKYNYGDNPTCLGALCGQLVCKFDCGS